MTHMKHFSMRMKCAVHDEPFIVKFESGGDLLYRPVSIIKPRDADFDLLNADHHEDDFGFVPLAAGRLKLHRLQCPHCGAIHRNKPFFLCGDCDNFICSGRRTDHKVICSPSCGRVENKNGLSQVTNIMAAPVFPGLDQTTSRIRRSSQASTSRALVLHGSSS